MNTEIRIKIPETLKERLELMDIDINQAIERALNALILESEIREKLVEVSLQKDVNEITTEDIPPGHFAEIPSLPLEEFERIVDETCWEYLDGKLIHHSPESNLHNAILNFLIFRAKATLDPHKFITRASRVAISIGSHKPEPDLMVFDRDDFRKEKRKDGSESEIIASTPLLIIEIISPSSKSIDEGKVEKYLSKGVREYWQISTIEEPITIQVFNLKEGQYEGKTYREGEVRSRHLPEFSVLFEELANPDDVSL